MLALADLHNLAGWTSFDVGMFSVARRHFGRALEQAREASDHSLVANILYRMGRLHLHQGMSRDALRFFQLGQIAAQDSECGLTVAMLCANEAWAYALIGDRRQMARSVGRAQDEFAKADHANARAWVRFFGEADLRASIGVAQISIENPTDTEIGDAVEQIAHAIRLRGPEMTRSRTFELTALSTAYLRGGDRDHGLRAAQDAGSSAETVRSIRILDRLEPLQQLADQRARDADFSQLAQRIKILRTAA
jgi:tetratricopeptide (TPR) repeat protein